MIVISNIAGIFVFDDDYTLIDNVPNPNPSDDWNDEELAVIKKYGKVYFLGRKKTKQENVTQTQDPSKMKLILKNNPDFIQMLKEANKTLTIENINKELNDDSHRISRSISIIEDINEALKLLARRVYEEAEFYNPNLIQEETEDYENVLNEILKDHKSNIGAILTDMDKEHIQNILDQYSYLNQLKEREQNYLDEIMDDFCPYLKEAATAIIGAKLIKKAGSLKQLAFMPSSLIQILGAEKALFRHLKKKTAPPKHGMLIAHPSVMDAENKGKAARQLASKIMIAARKDYFGKKDEAE